MDEATALKYMLDDDAPRESKPGDMTHQCRGLVRSIQHHPILTREWLELTGSLRMLARIVQRDLSRAGDAAAPDVAGRDSASAGTLWDQGTSETAVRTLVEEAKVSLCLRMMHDFKAWDFDQRERAETLARAMQAHDLHEARAEQACRSFEQSLGVLLWRAFAHVETLQLTDIPLLIEHCALVLDHCDRHVDTNLDATVSLQDTIVLFYVSSLFTHAEALNNSEVLRRTRDSALLPLLVSHIRRHAKLRYPPELAFDVAKGLAALCDNEDFHTEFSTFFDGSFDPDQVRAFLELEDSLVAPLLEADKDREVRKVLRPLTDFLSKLRKKA
uniref:Uncharacterized protein n=1 Tax=Zooxanthella nutricula TaxID=1333877 RepID=A0A6U6J8M2_9DINO|mmetsp:Transcript_22499/g.67451  ORF Transcript_22499/g.67451 Transcript_22499/m.67451 type:complete len:329 (+) Transcript_22499:78-1064(+)